MQKREFFQAMYGGNGYFMELRAIHVGGGVRARTFVTTWKDVEQFSIKYGRDAEIYFGVAPRIKSGEGGGATNCRPPAALWIDADDERAARAELAMFDLDPSVIVRSGRGLHVYWMLRDMPDDMDQIKLALRQLAKRLEGDMRSAEPAHVLRIPGTMNHKYSPPRMVEIEEMRLDRLYDFSKIVDATTLKSAAYIKGRAYMDELPPAIQGEHGDDSTYAAACVLVRDLGLDHDDALSLMLEWNQKCAPPWTEAELMKKIRGADAYGTNEKGVSDPAVDFEEVAKSNGDANIGPIEESNFTKLSKKYKIVNDNGTLHVYEKIRNEELNCEEWRWSRRKDFLEICQSVERLPLYQYKHGKTKEGDPKYKYMPTGQYWLDHWPRKETFNGITMRPECREERTPDGMLNMWKGFAYMPKPGVWSIFKNFIFESICRWDPESYEYIMNWMARAIQYPAKPAETAIVLKGKKRTGKGTF